MPVLCGSETDAVRRAGKKESSPRLSPRAFQKKSGERRGGKPRSRARAEEEAEQLERRQIQFDLVKTSRRRVERSAAVTGGSVERRFFFGVVIIIFISCWVSVAVG